MVKVKDNNKKNNGGVGKVRGVKEAVREKSMNVHGAEVTF